ncbi:transposase InsO family protein [Rhizobium sp. BK399]|nr:transposase InsO family protein [Rhizobium sp. BK399]
MPVLSRQSGAFNGSDSVVALRRRTSGVFGTSLSQSQVDGINRILDALASHGRGKTLAYPRTIRVDQGTEFVSRDLDLWAYAKGVTLDFSRPGKPTDNAFIEAFNGRFRAECLNQRWLLILADAREKMEDWRRDDNEVRPHGAIGNKVPIPLMNSGGNQPASLNEAGKLQPLLVQKPGAVQTPENSSSH